MSTEEVPLAKANTKVETDQHTQRDWDHPGGNLPDFKRHMWILYREQMIVSAMTEAFSPICFTSIKIWTSQSWESYSSWREATVTIKVLGPIDIFTEVVLSKVINIPLTKVNLILPLRPAKDAICKELGAELCRSIHHEEGRLQLQAKGDCNCKRTKWVVHTRHRTNRQQV